MKDIKNWIENEATDAELLDLVIEVNIYNGELEKYVFYAMEELDELFVGTKPTEYGLESCSMRDAVEDIRNNADEIAEAVEDAIDEIDLPESLMEE